MTQTKWFMFVPQKIWLRPNFCWLRQYFIWLRPNLRCQCTISHDSATIERFDCVPKGLPFQFILQNSHGHTSKRLTRIFFGGVINFQQTGTQFHTTPPKKNACVRFWRLFHIVLRPTHSYSGRSHVFDAVPDRKIICWAKNKLTSTLF
jgi:hypothetical protein